MRTVGDLECPDSFLGCHGSVKSDAKLVIQTRTKQYRIDVGVCKETLSTITRKALDKVRARGRLVRSFAIEDRFTTKRAMDYFS